MMVSFHYFLIIAILLPSVLGGDNLKCINKTESILPSELCCDGDIYTLDYLIRPVTSCNVEPKNTTLTFTDSAWLAFDCNVRKRLNSTDLTLKSYFNLLVKAVKPNKSLLWNKLKFQNDISQKTASEDEYDKIQTIKLYQREFSEALEQTCTFGSMKSNSNMPIDLLSMSFKTRLPFLQHNFPCNGEMLPFSGFHAAYDDRKLAQGHAIKCNQEFHNMLGNATHHRYRYNIVILCRPSGRQNLDIIKAEIKNPKLDLEGIVRSFLPSFWSKWVKNAVQNSIIEGLKEEYNIQEQGNLESLIRNKIEERINHEVAEGIHGKSLTNKREIVQAILIFSVNDVFRATTKNICRIDADRKENAGV